MNLRNIIKLANHKYFDGKWYIKKYKKLPYFSLMKYYAAYKYIKYGEKRKHLINQYMHNDEFCMFHNSKSVLSGILSGQRSPIYDKMYNDMDITQYNELDYNIIQIKYNKAINKLKSKDVINVLFIVNLASVFPAENLMKKLKNNKRYSVLICVAPRINQDIKSMEEEYNKALNELQEKYGNIVKGAIKIKNGIIEDVTDYVKKCDIICYPTPYDYNLLYYKPCYAFYHGKLNIHINYGFFRGIYDRVIYKLENYNKFWKVFLETEISQREYREYGLYNGENSVVTGYSKMDRFVEFKKPYKNDKKIIIIAPHHTTGEDAPKEIRISNFEKYEKLFLELPAKYTNVHFHYRPHPLLFPKLKNMKGNKYIEDYIHKLKTYENVTLDEKGDYFEIFAKADGIIQDCGSFLAEWFYTDKPGCYMLADESSKDKYFNELGKKCLDNTYIAYNENDIYNYIEEVIIKENDYMKERRNKFAKELKVNYPHATEKIIEHIEKELNR